MESPLLVLFGDSIANGLGVRSERYAEQVAHQLGASLYDRSGTACRVDESSRFADEVADTLSHRQSPGTVTTLIAHGITEAIVRPRPEQMKMLPKRWKRTGWMDPRPYYSSSLRKRAFQRFESEIRWRTKNFLIKRRGSTTLLGPDDYRRHLTDLISKAAMFSDAIVIVGPPPISEKYFPGSTESEQHYWDIARRVAADRGIICVSVLNDLHEPEHFLLDGFHPNSSGHRVMAERIMQELS